MRYMLVWKPEAEQRLAEIWLADSDRQAVADAANTIELELRNHPEHIGESREGKARILFVPPLAVDYRVYPEDRRVNVIALWRTAPPPPQSEEP